jgi:hypothetical protein
MLRLALLQVQRRKSCRIGQAVALYVDTPPDDRFSASANK